MADLDLNKLARDAAPATTDFLFLAPAEGVSIPGTADSASDAVAAAAPPTLVTLGDAISTGVLDWAVTGSANPIPSAKLANQRFTVADQTKLDAIETSATRDQTPSEIITGINTQLGGTDWQSGGGGDVGDGLTQADVDARVRAGVENWAEAGNAQQIPLTKIPSEIARDSEIPDVSSFLDGAAVDSRIRTRVEDFAEAGNAAQVPDAKIPAGVTRDNEVEDFATVGDNTQIPDSKIPAGIARDSELSGFLTEAQVDTRVRAGVANFAEAGNNTPLPSSKLPDGTANLSDIADWAEQGNASAIPASKLANAPGGLTQAEVDTRVRTGVADWAETGNGDLIPANKLLNAPSGGGGGSSTFAGLTDTPAALGAAGQQVIVNPAGNALIFADAAPGTGGGGGSALELLNDANFDIVGDFTYTDTGISVADHDLFFLSVGTAASGRGGGGWFSGEELRARDAQVAGNSASPGDAISVTLYDTNTLLVARTAANTLLLAAVDEEDYDPMPLTVYGLSRGSGGGGGGGGNATHLVGMGNFNVTVNNGWASEANSADITLDDSDWFWVAARDGGHPTDYHRINGDEWRGLTAANFGGGSGITGHSIRVITGDNVGGTFYLYLGRTASNRVLVGSTSIADDAMPLVVYGEDEASGGGGGSSTFAGLTDTPSTLGTTGQVPAVNAAGNALEFVDVPTGGGGGGLTQAQVDARVEAGVENWAESGNATLIPANKLANAPGLTQGEVDARVEFGVADWAEQGNAAAIPANKLGNAISEAQVDARVAAGVQDWAETGNAAQIPAAKIPAGSFAALTDTPAALGTEGQVAVVNAARDALVFADPATGDPEELTKELFGNFDDLLASTSMSFDAPAATSEQGNSWRTITSGDLVTLTAAQYSAGESLQGRTRFRIDSFGITPFEYRVRIRNGTSVLATVHFTENEGTSGFTKDFDATLPNTGGILLYRYELQARVSGILRGQIFFNDIKLHHGDGAASAAVRAEVSRDTEPLRDAIAADWAQADNTDAIPADKLTNAGGGGSHLVGQGTFNVTTADIYAREANSADITWDDSDWFFVSADVRRSTTSATRIPSEFHRIRGDDIRGLRSSSYGDFSSSNPPAYIEVSNVNSSGTDIVRLGRTRDNKVLVTTNSEHRDLHPLVIYGETGATGGGGGGGDGGGLTQAQVDARARAITATWAQVGDTTQIPANKLANTPQGVWSPAVIGSANVNFQTFERYVSTGIRIPADVDWFIIASEGSNRSRASSWVYAPNWRALAQVSTGSGVDAGNFIHLGRFSLGLAVFAGRGSNGTLLLAADDTTDNDLMPVTVFNPGSISSAGGAVGGAEADLTSQIDARIAAFARAQNTDQVPDDKVRDLLNEIQRLKDRLNLLES